MREIIYVYHKIIIGNLMFVCEKNKRFFMVS